MNGHRYNSAPYCAKCGGPCESTVDRPATFVIGQRVELHPACDAWMQGDRFGVVAKIGTKYVHVKMDRSGRTLVKLPRNVLEIS
jgi:hypothetical protein